MFVKIYSLDNKPYIVNTDNILCIAEHRHRGTYLVALSDNIGVKIDIDEKQRLCNMLGYV